VDFYLNAGTPMETSWWWPTSANGALQPGKTYVLGGNLDGVNGYAEFNVSFTYSSSCTATSYCSSCTAYPLSAPANNKGWRYQFTQITNLSAELPATQSQDPKISVFTGPTVFGTTRAPKISLYFDFIDVCKCIFVNWIGYITQDNSTSNPYKAHYWNSQTDKRSEKSNDGVDLRSTNYTSHKSQGNKRNCLANVICPGQTYCATTISNCGSCRAPCITAYTPASVQLPNTELSGANSWVPVDKRQSQTYWLYYLPINQTACTPLPNVGSYGNGPNGISVSAHTSLGVSYL